MLFNYRVPRKQLAKAYIFSRKRLARPYSVSDLFLPQLEDGFSQHLKQAIKILGSALCGGVNSPAGVVR